jgi:hypothetical protein
MTKKTLLTMLLALVVALAVSSTALAQGGGGGGVIAGTSCARILEFARPTTYDANNQPLLQTSFTASYTCVDHEMTGRAAIDYYDGAGNHTGRSFWQWGGGTFSWSSGVSPASPGSFTLVLSVYLPNGKVADQRTITTIIPAT